MSRARFFRSTGLRLLAWYAAVFVTSVAILLAVVYWITAAELDQQLRESVERETDVLAELYRERGVETAVRAIQLRLADLRAPRRYYLLQNASGTRLAGNLPVMKPREGAFTLPGTMLSRDRGQKSAAADSYPVVAMGHVLASGDFLVVGENRYRAVKAREAVLLAVGWGIAISLLLAAGGGAALGRGFLRRIEAINRTTRSIMEGELSKRVPTRGGEDEIDQLAINFNGMLDRIQTLMENVKQVSDDIAHDLRTPLSRLRHRLEAARAGPADECGPAIEQAIIELDDILDTFSGLLRIAQIEAGARRAAFTKVPLSQVLAAVAEAYEAVAEDRGQRLVVKVERDAVISGDRELLTQMTANLVENAIRHGVPGVEIQARVTEEAGAPVLIVADTGPGIPASERHNVLRRFYRLEASRTTPGSGLGLALVKAVADLHGASIEMSDNQPGLCIAIRFPARHA